MALGLIPGGPVPLPIPHPTPDPNSWAYSPHPSILTVQPNPRIPGPQRSLLTLPGLSPGKETPPPALRRPLEPLPHPAPPAPGPPLLPPLPLPWALGPACDLLTQLQPWPLDPTPSPHQPVSPRPPLFPVREGLPPIPPPRPLLGSFPLSALTTRTRVFVSGQAATSGAHPTAGAHRAADPPPRPPIRARPGPSRSPAHQPGCSCRPPRPLSSGPQAALHPRRARGSPRSRARGLLSLPLRPRPPSGDAPPPSPESPGRRPVWGLWALPARPSCEPPWIADRLGASLRRRLSGPSSPLRPIRAAAGAPRPARRPVAQSARPRRPQSPVRSLRPRAVRQASAP